VVEQKPEDARQGPRWAIFSWLILRNSDLSLYLKRFRIIQTPWFGVYIHWIYSTDSGRDLHDHPWPFVSVLLRGWYTEQIATELAENRLFVTEHAVQWINRKPATGLHRITWLSRTPIVTLVFAGRRCREWGFMREDGVWVIAEKYFKQGNGMWKESKLPV
jgi:hypothetical protein